MRLLLLSTYELGHQPLHAASPAGALRVAGHEVRCLDLSIQKLEAAELDWADAVGVSVPMHTAMRLGIKAKQIAGVTAIVGLAIVALSALNLTRLARVVLRESDARGELVANTIFHRAREVVTGTPNAYSAMQNDPGLRAMLEASIYGESIVDAAILDAQGVVVASSDPTFEGKRMRPRGGLDALMGASAWEQLKVIYSREGQILEVRQSMMLGEQAFGSIAIGVSTLLMRQELTASVQPALYTAAGRPSEPGCRGGPAMQPLHGARRGSSP